MLEKVVHAGEFFDIGSLDSYTQPLNTGQVSVSCTERQIDVTRVLFGKNKLVALNGTNRKNPQRNFIWVPYAPNAINYTETQGRDVLSGPFSGCYMVVYNYKRSRRVAHIATPQANTPGGAVPAWNRLVASDPDIEVVAGFRPHEHIGSLSNLMKPTDSAFKCFGLVTGTNALWTIATFSQRDPETKVVSPYFRILAITAVTSMTIQELSVLP